MSTAQNEGPADTIQLEGLEGPVRIATDKWGIPHIYGDTLQDVLCAQGFYVARERLWQLDYWWRCGLGRLAEAFGKKYVARDRAARLFLYRGDMDAEWASYSPDTKMLLEAFTRGINAFIKLTREDASLLPPEFEALDYRPELWTAADITRIRSHGLYQNLRHEVTRARVMRDYGPEVEDLRRQREPAHSVRIPEGLDLNSIPDDVLAVYDLITNPPTFPAEADAVFDKKRPPEGSNNWSISGARTESGRPILANDPHRVMTSLPSMRYLVHLCTPELDAIGGSEIAIPGLMTGHNGHIAFGITFCPVDQEDLYVYELNPENSQQYRYGDQWETIRTVTETIPVRGSDPVEVELAYTRHGPIIHHSADANRAFAIRAAWLEAGMAPYLGGVSTMRARSWESFLEASRHWKAPCSNLIYADVEGNIGWKIAGLIPTRKNWDGTMPVPGDGRYEWDGFFASDQLPRIYNPECGWVATANEMNIPADFPDDAVLGYDWHARLRKDRIDEVLGSSVAHTVTSSAALQNDYCNLLARRMITRMKTLPIADADSHEGLSMLLAWDAIMGADSAPAALFEVWYRKYFRTQLIKRALAQHVDATAVEQAAKAISSTDLLPDPRVDLNLFESPGNRLGAEPEAWLARMVVETLDEAIAYLSRKLGGDMASWQWGALHTAQMAHPLRRLLKHKMDASHLVTPIVPRGGSGDTVGLTAYAADFTQLAGSTLRVVVDVGEWDKSVAMNAPGQSGRPGTLFAENLMQDWAEGKSLPLLYSSDQVASATVHEYVLKPTP